MRQKLQEELKNTPVGASQAYCSVTQQLNKVETHSAVGGGVDLSTTHELACNNPEVNLQDAQPGLRKQYCFVLNANGKPLMPCSPTVARKRLKDGVAKVVRNYPFVIQLLTQDRGATQPLTMGIDTGAKHIGLSIISEKQEYVSQEVELDKKTHDRLVDRAMYRRGRRNRHHWYRAPRFNNRKRKDGWLPPSVERGYQTHLNLIKFWKRYLPITEVVVEVGNFDMQKLNNTEIDGVEYQQGEMFGYNNMKAYILSREKCTCQLCGKSVVGKKINLHHIIPRSKGGTDKPGNLGLLHEDCHKKLHKENLHNKLKKCKMYKESTFMNIIRSRFEKVQGIKLTYGYETQTVRNSLKIDKSHVNDGFVIAGGVLQSRCTTVYCRQKRRNNRGLSIQRNGYKPSVRRQRYKIQSGDLVWVNGGVYESKGCFNKGSWVRLTNGRSVSMKKIDRWYNFGGIIWGLNMGVAKPHVDNNIK